MAPAVAQADDDIVAPGSGIAGNSALGYLLDDYDEPHEPIFNGEGDFLPNLFENDYWWFGPSNPEAPPERTAWVIDVYSVLPSGLKPLWGWFLNGDIDWTACVGGVGVRWGPYGSLTGTVASHC
ncbi:MAG: hypothetical protein ABWY45_22370 [Mycobacterium sp.]